MEPKFAQTGTSNLILPAVLALAAFFTVMFLVLRYTPNRTADLAIGKTNVYQAHTVFHSDTILIKKDSAEDAFYVLTTLHIDDRLNLPLFIKDLTGNVTLADGRTLTTNAAEKTELTPILTTFPALKPLASEPLLRDTLIPPGHSAEGMILLQFPITLDAWNHRQSAAVTVDFYHQGTQTVPIPK